MRTPTQALYRYTPQAIEAANKIPAGCVNEHSHKMGMLNAEPIIIAMDCLLKYAEAYHARFDQRIGEAYVLSNAMQEAVDGLMGLCDCDGAVALSNGITTDSKDNAAVFAMRDAVYGAAGFDKE